MRGEHRKFAFAAVERAAWTAVLLGVALAAFLGVLRARLPPLGSALDVQEALARRFELERALLSRDMAASVRFTVTPVAALPDVFARATLAHGFCPDFLESPKAPLWRRLLALLDRQFGIGAPLSAGAERCQLRFSVAIAQAIGLPPTWERPFAEFWILSALTPQELFEIYVASLHYAPGIIGPASAAQALFQKPLGELQPALVAELVMAEASFQRQLACDEPLRLRAGRDRVLDEMEAFGVLTVEASARAKGARVSCVGGLSGVGTQASSPKSKRL